MGDFIIPLPTNEQIGRIIELLDGITFEHIPSKIVAVRRSRVYRSVNNVTEVSFDGGNTWSPATGIPETIVVGHVLQNGVALLFSDTTLYRSTDGTNFTGTLFTTLGFSYRPYYTGIGSGEDQYCPASRVIFGEYHPTGTCALWKSDDSGATWTNVLAPTEIRHFHTVQWNPQTLKWYVTSGDANAEIHWWEGNPAGDFWTKIFNGSTTTNNPQKYRCLGQVFDQSDYLYWVTDSDLSSISSIQKAKYTDLQSTEKVLDLPNIGYGFQIVGSIWVVICRPKNVSPNSMTYLYLSMDGGKTWRIAKKDYCTSISDGGYYEVHRANDRGDFFINIRDIEGYTTGALRMKMEV